MHYNKSSTKNNWLSMVGASCLFILIGAQDCIANWVTTLFI